MAFQIIDDVLDLTASEEVLGKPVASDLREGKATMAVIHSMERCTPEERMVVESVLQKRAFDEIQPADVISILNRYNSIDYATAAAADYAATARVALTGFPESEIKRALLWIPDFVLQRDN
jgi:octaprenyl-diphosphate synthase